MKKKKTLRQRLGEPLRPTGTSERINYEMNRLGRRLAEVAATIETDAIRQAFDRFDKEEKDRWRPNLAETILQQRTIGRLDGVRQLKRRLLVAESLAAWERKGS